MDNNYTAMLLVVDRSGSMASIRAEMEESLQALLAEQAKEPGLTTVDLATFDTAYELNHRMADPANVKVEIHPRGGTALWDTLRFCVEGFSKELADLPEHAKPGKVIMVVATDGEENSSVTTNLATVKEMIQSKQDHEQWEMVFLGANQDAIKEAKNLIAMIKITVPQMACTVIDRAIQIHGGMGVSQDTPLAKFYVYARTVRLADGPDEVHMFQLGRNLAKEYES